jgi:alpha-L-arabinofuranosidase
MMQELARAREAQQNSKLQQRADMAYVEHEDFMRVLAVNRAKEQEEMTQTVTSMEINHKYKEELLAQIQVNEERRKKERQDYLEEGSRMRQQQELEKQRLLQIKQSKLSQLESMGVPSKYQAELERMRIKA